mgnify:CR=1 FL=1|tara:strand:- start:48 stop:1934 length:1887 start_codon:yes stop_codon:yes gene_type:complete
MGMLDRMRGDLTNRYERMGNRKDQYEAGEISGPEYRLSAAATAIGTIADPVGRLVIEAADWLTPPALDQALKDLAANAMDTEPVKKLMQAAEENPRVAATLMDFLDVGGAISGYGAAKKVGGEFAKDLAKAAPNKQGSSFYGSGVVGQVASLLKTSPQAVVDTVTAYTSPAEMAKLNTNPEALQRVYKEALKAKDSKSASWVEGQADQQVMLLTASGKPVRGPLRDFMDAQYTVTGDLTDGTLKQIIDTNPNVKAYGMDVDDEMLSVLRQRIMTAQNISPNEPAPLAMGRNDGFASDVGPEYMAGHGSNVVNNLYRASKVRQRIYGDTPFVGDEYLDFAALARIERKTLQGRNGDANWGEKKISKAFGPDTAKEFGIAPQQNRSDANSMIDSYFSLKKRTADADLAADYFKQQAKAIKDANPSVNFKGRAVGQDKEIIKAYKAAIAAEKKAFNKVNTTARKKYSDIQKRISEVKAAFTLDSKGRVYFGDSHKSRLKALGGVNDQIVMDKDGNILTVINDENDLMGEIPAGHRRTIAIPRPHVYNVFQRKAPVSIAKENKGIKDTFIASMQERGAGKQPRTPAGMNRLLGEALERYTPEVTSADTQRVRAAQGGMLAFTPYVGAMNDEE